MNKIDKKSPCWKGYEQYGMKIKNGKKVPNCIPKKSVNEEMQKNYMFFENIELIEKWVKHLNSMNANEIDKILDEHSWIVDHIATSKDDIEEVYNFLTNKLNEYTVDDNYALEFVKELKKCKSDLKEDMIEEAEYQGRKVTLNKPMRGDVKKFKVYVKNDKGNIIKVNFGDPDMRIKKSNPKRRKSFRARHNCDNPGPKWKARYWSCKMW